MFCSIASFFPFLEFLHSVTFLARNRAAKRKDGRGSYFHMSASIKNAAFQKTLFNSLFYCQRQLLIAIKCAQDSMYDDTDMAFETSAASASAASSVTSPLVSSQTEDAFRVTTCAAARNTSPITIASQNGRSPVENSPAVTEVQANKSAQNAPPPSLPVRPPRLKHALRKEASPAQVFLCMQCLNGFVFIHLSSSARLHLIMLSF